MHDKYAKGGGGGSGGGGIDQVNTADVAASIASSARSMLERLAFSNVLGQLNQRQAQLQGIEDSLRRLRSRGFAFWPNLEAQLDEARHAAEGAMRTARDESQRTASSLRTRLESVGSRAGTLAARSHAGSGSVDALGSELEMLGGELDAAEARLNELAKPFTALVDKVRAGVDGSHWTMDQFDAASFKPRAEENPLCVAGATWENGPSGATPGVLYLTDLVVRFEQRPAAGGSRRVALEEPIGNVQNSEDSERGWFIKDEVLTLTWGTSGRARGQSVFKLDSSDSKVLDDFIEMVRSGQIAAHKVRTNTAPVAASAAVPAKWPGECAECGGEIEPPVRGQAQVVCPYCQRSYPVEFAS